MIVAIYLPTETRKKRLVVDSGDLDDRTLQGSQGQLAKSTGQTASAQTSNQTKEYSMSRRGIHPLLMGLERTQQATTSRQRFQLTGLESGQRKRYLRSEAEDAAKAAAVSHSIQQLN